MVYHHEHILRLVQTGDLGGLVEATSGLEVPWRVVKYSKLGDNMMHIACRHGRFDVLKYLIENAKGLSFEDTNAEWKRPLHEAAQYCETDCVGLLVKNGADINALKRADWTPLMLACTRYGNLAVVKILIEAGALTKLKNKDGWTAFHIACREGDLETITYLFNTDRSLFDTSSRNGRTPLHTAALHGRLHVLKILLERCGVPVDVQDFCGTTPLMDSLRNGHVDVAEELILKGADKNRRDRTGRHCIHLAAESGSLASLNFVLDKFNIDVNTPSDCGSVALHFAAREGNIEAVQYLLRRGADLGARDNKGRTALDLAMDRNISEVVDLLKSTDVMQTMKS